MKRQNGWMLVLLTAILLTACAGAPEQTDPLQSLPTAEQTVPTTAPQQPGETTEPTVITGWVEENGAKYYYSPEGVPVTGWQQVEENRYYFQQDGKLYIGWLQTESGKYFLGMDGVQRTGWIESDGKRYYLNPETQGAVHVGWLDLEADRYYLDDQGVMQTGWLTLGENRYYLKADGCVARGRMEIDGKVWWFTRSGASVILVNPWNFVPDDYTAVIVNTENGHRVSAACADALAQMLSDCRKAGLNPQIASSYRTHGDQIYLYDRKVNYYLSLGYSEADAKAVAGTIIAYPGTSEHELGLALDLVDNSNWNLDESQEKTPVQQWLMANSWRYGFILRYPNGKSDVTGIIYEPWHYRYVGVELAKELYESGLCLEEYLNGLQ